MPDTETRRIFNGIIIKPWTRVTGTENDELLKITAIFSEMLKFSQNIQFQRKKIMKEKKIFKKYSEIFCIKHEIFKIRWLFDIEMLNFVCY